MTIAEITIKMIEYSDGNLRDIEHFLKVYAYAKTIGEREGLSDRELLTLEISALLHDIACPLCRRKYGDTNWKHQEAEGPALAREFLRGSGLADDIVERVCFLVGRHHTYAGADGPDYQILLEADYLVNASESHYSAENIRGTMERLFRTAAGSALLLSIYKTE